MEHVLPQALRDEMRLAMLALARFNLLIANDLCRPATDVVEFRRRLQNQARDLIDRAGTSPAGRA